MYSRHLGQFISYCTGLTLVTIMIFGALRWLNIPSGHFIDWIIGTLTLWWLLVIVTVPWNVYFEAKAVSAEAAHSTSIGITVDQKQMKYVKNVERIALTVAISLHIFSALGLFALSACGISPVGYVASAAALLLTAVRPSVRAYEYLWERLVAIKHRVQYPREDVVELRNRTLVLEQKVEALEQQLDTARPASFAAAQTRSLEELKIKLNTVSSNQNRLQDENQREHERLLREGQNAIAKISSDSQFLDHVREIVRLIKSA
jgi:hypothetical protein